MLSDELGCGEAFRQPFSYYVTERALTNRAGEDMLHWLENDAPWQLVEGSFYEQYEINFHNVQLPPMLSAIASPDCLRRVKDVVEKKFDVVLSDQVNFVAHKLAPGQKIRVHNDHMPGQQTHRLLIQLNKNWSYENGGLLIFFNSNNAKDVHKVFQPIHNSCVAFEMTENSYHAVSTINNGERFTLVFSFYQKESA
jgi:Rps23 Pro-64 3,4-dihydroxylase Tpa1-like proline 4-hydroxylase